MTNEQVYRSKMTHTSGPWTVIEKCEGTQVIVSGPEDWVGVALVYGDTDEEAEANARLIAAAPELLDAIELAYDLLNTMTTSEYSRGGDANVRHVLRTAIAKAKGE
jgi:hypothetical protein